MSLEIYNNMDSMNSQAHFSHSNKTDEDAGHGVQPAQRDAVDLSIRSFNHETRFEINPETNRVVVKIIDKDTKEVLKKISDKGVEVLSNVVGGSTGGAFRDLTI